MDENNVDQEQEDARIHSIEQGMRDAGESLTETVQADYFGFEETHSITLPDSKSVIYHKTLNEGQRRKYQNALNKDVRIQRASGDAIMRMAPGDEKKELLSAAIVDWNLARGGQPVPFQKRNLDEFLDKADPRIIDLIEKEIRKVNSWLQADMSVEDIQREINQLEELKSRKLDEDDEKKRFEQKVEQFVKGQTIEGGVPESLRLFALCDAMEWNHLPQAGGLYDQHPQIIDDFQVIFGIRSAYEKRRRQRRNGILLNRHERSR